VIFGKRKNDASLVGNAVRSSASWLAWPTLRCGGGQIKTAGVLHHQDALRRVHAAVGSLAMAELKIETTGQYAGAVRVFVAGESLGSIPHDLAEKFRAVIEELGKSDQPATCRVELEVEDWLNVWLDARPMRRPDDDPFLPPLSSETVQLYPGQAERLDAAFQSKAKSKRVIGLGRLSALEGSWELAIDETPVGILQGGRYSALGEVVDAGFPLTCQVRMIRDPGRAFRVMADIPRDRVP
jgi:hypothetical protein